MFTNHKIKVLIGIFVLTLLLSSSIPNGVIATSLLDQGRTPGVSKTPAKSINSATAIVVEELSSLLTPEDLATILVGTGVSITNAQYTGVDVASGVFYGGTDVVGFENGVLLTSGSVHNVVGPNISDSISLSNDAPGDPDLDQLSGYTTYDASVFEFDFVPAVENIYFNYVFASDEYNEYVHSSFNDVFAFYVNGENCALVEGDPVSINTINYGYPFGTTPYEHPEYYINNDLSDGGGAIDTEMDGLTNELTCWAQVNPGQTNHMELKIADASDHVFDSAVFIEGGSLQSEIIVELTGLEVTQAIQDLNDSVFMVQDKRTYVRAHVRSRSGTIHNAKTRLLGKRGDTVLDGSPLSPSNLGGNIDIRETPNRSALNDSFSFELPSAWLNGTVEFELVELSNEIDCMDHADTDEDCKVQVTFEETAEPEVRLVGIRWTDGGGTLHDPNAGDYAAVVQDIEAQYPIPDLDWDNPTELDVAGDPPDLGALLVTVNNQRTLDGSDRVYFGLLVDHTSGGLGLGYTPGWASVGYYRPTDPTTASHEIGHNLGRLHTECTGGEANTDPAYPYTDGHISEDDTGDDAFHGFHIDTLNIISPSSGDLMGYCRPRWVSDHTYGEMRTEIVDRWGGPLVRPTTLMAGEPAVLVSGMIHLDLGTGEFGTILMLDSPTSLTLLEAGDYTVRFLDQHGAMINEYDFVPQVPDDGDGQLGIFSFLLPWDADTVEIVLLEGESFLASSAASEHAPTVTLNSPNGGEIWSGDEATVEWTANDTDGDDLEFTVQYRTGAGSNWITLATGIDAFTTTVNLTTLPGSDQALVRVLASDGFHTREDVSDATFTNTRHAPVVEIKSPDSGSLFVENQMIILWGNARDVEDGELLGASLVWVSSLDGELGTGKSIAVNASSLTEGDHIITLNAEDSDSQLGSDTIVITVYRNKPFLPPSLAVAPDFITFSSIVGDSTIQTLDLALRNNGDGTIIWESSSDQSWLTASQVIGFTPTDVVLSVSAAGLSSGVYNGTLTFTDTQSPETPVIVQVELIVQQAKVFLPIIIK